jgi:hypothetical protein
MHKNKALNYQQNEQTVWTENYTKLSRDKIDIWNYITKIKLSMYQTVQATRKLDKSALQLMLLLIRQKQMVEEKCTKDTGAIQQHATKQKVEQDITLRYK